MDVDKWTLGDIIDACAPKPTKKRKMQIPKFQRRRVWTSEKEDALIDTLKSSNISIGVLQLWKIGTIDGLDNYLLVDGLHRTSTLTKYYNDPFSFGRSRKMILDIIRNVVDTYQTYKKEDIESCCLKWFSKETLGTYEEFAESKDYAEKGEELREIIKVVADKKDKEPMAKFIMEKTKELAKNMNISNSVIPVILNAGTLDDLATLFKRINQNGTPLSLCDVLAAVWINTKIKIKNKEIVTCIADHYKELKQENNNMDIYMINDDKTYSAYEYMIGLKRYLSKKFENTFLGLIKDKEFIFKLVACCYYEDIGKKSIEKLNTTLIGENLTELEQKLEWSIGFVSKIFDKVAIYDKKLIVKEVPIYIATISLAFSNKSKISKKEDYYVNLFLVNILNDKLSDRNFNNKIIKSVVTEKRYLNKIYKAEFIEKMNRFVSDGVKLFGKNDRNPNTTTKLILTTLNKIYNDPDLEVKFGNIITKKIIIDKNKKSTISVNCLGNVCLYTRGDHDRKPTQTIVNYLTSEGVSDEDIEETVMFMDGETKYDSMLDKSSDFDKTKYVEFVKFRGKKIKEQLLEVFKANMKDDSDDENSDSDASDLNTSDSEHDDKSNSDSEESSDSDKSSDSEEEKPTKKSSEKSKNAKSEKLAKSDRHNDSASGSDSDSDSDSGSKKKKHTKKQKSDSQDTENEKPKKIVKNTSNRISIKVD